MRRWRSFGGAAAAALVVLSIGPAIGPVIGPVLAQQGDDPSWMRRLGLGYPGSDVPDRQFMRRWQASPAKGLPTLSRDNIAPMQDAIARYAAIAAKGGWRSLPDVKLRQGSSHPAVALLRRRLHLSGELRSASDSEYFDNEVDQAVQRFQAANGLPPTGVVDRRTIAAMNVPAAARLKQLRTNLARLQGIGKTPGKYIAVNIPAAQIEAVENDRVVSRHAGVVGKIDRPTPVLESAIHEFNFNPVWHLPPTVIEKDLIPRGREMARRGQSVLVKFGIDAYGGSGKLDPKKVDWSSPGVRGLAFRQQPGPENPLGFVKMNFPNGHAVYMHDTPSQSLFGRGFRAASSGCVRINGIEALVAWVASDQGWGLQRVRQMKESGERQDVRLKRPIRLYFAYITAWATPDGQVHFRPDIYRKDGVRALAGSY